MPGDPPAPAASIALEAVAPRQAHTVVEVVGDDALARRLASAGLWPGASIELLVRAPFGDPMLFRLHGYRLALRRSEAARVLVHPAGGQP